MPGRGRPPKGAPKPASDLVELVEIWKLAAAAPKGIAVPCKNPNRLMQKLYAARREVGGFPDLKIIELPTELKIVPKNP